MKETQTVESLRLKARKLEGRARELEEQERDRVSRPILRKSVGKCFMFVNSYGGNYSKWPLYARIVSFDEKNMTFQTVQFQHTSRSIVEIRYRVEHNFDGKNHFAGESSGWSPITNREYESARKKALKLVKELLCPEHAKRIKGLVRT